MQPTDINRLRGLPIEEVAKRLGVGISRHQALCPFHDDSHPSLHFSEKRNTFKCFVCGAHGSSIDLAMRVLAKNFTEACQWLADEHNIIIATTPTTTDTEKKGNTTFDPARYLPYIDHPTLSPKARQFLYDQRKIDPRVAQWCRLSSWKDKKGVNWLFIPYFDIEGKLIGVQNRNLDYRKDKPDATGSPRFRFPRGCKCAIYNLPVLKMLKKDEPLFITEGTSDCWAMLSSGHKAIAIPSATALGRDGRMTLRQFTDNYGPLNLHMYPDADIPGEKLYLELVALATELKSCITRHSLPYGCKDFAEYYISKQQNNIQLS